MGTLTMQVDPAIHLQHLCDTVGSLIPTFYHGSSPSSVPLGLRQSKFIFIWCYTHCTTLQKPYEGPYRVLESGTKPLKWT